MKFAKKKNYLKDIWKKLDIGNLSSREKWIMGGGVAFVVCFFILQVIIMPFFEAKGRLAESVSRKERELADIQLLRQEYLGLKNEEDSIQTRIEQRGGGFTLFTFLDRQADKAKVRKQIQYMKPSTSEGDDMLDEAMVEMKLQQVTLEALVDFLRLIESKENVVFIRRISIQESGDSEGYLDSIMQIVTFELKG
ncbi:MAG: type II secretion system protein GspM [Desulforhopalus sp.]